MTPSTMQSHVTKSSYPGRGRKEAVSSPMPMVTCSDRVPSLFRRSVILRMSPNSPTSLTLSVMLIVLQQASKHFAASMGSFWQQTAEITAIPCTPACMTIGALSLVMPPMAMMGRAISSTTCFKRPSPPLGQHLPSRAWGRQDQNRYNLRLPINRCEPLPRYLLIHR